MAQFNPELGVAHEREVLEMAFPDGWRPVVYWFAPGTEPDKRSERRFSVELAFVMKPAELVEYTVGIDPAVAAVRIAGVIFDLAFSDVARGRMLLLLALAADRWKDQNLPWSQIQPSALTLRGQVDRGELTWEEARKGTVFALHIQFGPGRSLLRDPRFVRRLPGRPRPPS